MRQPDWTLERAEVERVASEYRGRGYQVIVAPSAAELPDFVRDYPPDIVARSGQESVLIEVTRHQPGTDRGRLRAIAERVERQPGWRFVVVSTPPQGSPPYGEAFRPLDAAAARRRLSEAEALTSAGHREAALLVYWAALEAAMRFAAQRYGVEIPRSDAWSLMRELVSNGVLDGAVYHELSEAFRLRSALAHGLEPVERVDFERVIGTLQATTDTLLRDCEASTPEASP